MSEKSAKKTRREKRGEEKTQPTDLTFFLVGARAEVNDNTQKEKSEEKAIFTDEAEKIILAELSQAGNKLSKSELYEKVIHRGVKPVMFYRSLTRLMERGKVKRVFDPEIEEYVYVLS